MQFSVVIYTSDSEELTGQIFSQKTVAGFPRQRNVVMATTLYARGRNGSLRNRLVRIKKVNDRLK